MVVLAGPVSGKPGKLRGRNIFHVVKYHFPNRTCLKAGAIPGVLRRARRIGQDLLQRFLHHHVGRDTFGLCDRDELGFLLRLSGKVIIMTASFILNL